VSVFLVRYLYLLLNLFPILFLLSQDNPRLCSEF
jgi:hypothetical protein